MQHTWIRFPLLLALLALAATLGPPAARAADLPSPVAPSLNAVTTSARPISERNESSEEEEGEHGGAVVVVPGWWGYGPGWWGGYGPGWWDPWWYGPRYGRDGTVVVRPPERGAAMVVLHVRPSKAEVRVDGVTVGEARDFDWASHPLWLKPGDHTVSLSAPGYETLREKVDTQKGLTFHLRYHLHRGEGVDPRSDAPEALG